jgi:hypothetical protein
MPSGDKGRPLNASGHKTDTIRQGEGIKKSQRERTRTVAKDYVLVQARGHSEDTTLPFNVLRFVRRVARQVWCGGINEISGTWTEEDEGEYEAGSQVGDVMWGEASGDYRWTYTPASFRAFVMATSRNSKEEGRCNRGHATHQR